MYDRFENERQVKTSKEAQKKKGTPKELHPWPPEKSGLQRVPHGFLTWNSVQFESWYMYDRFENERQVKISKGAQKKKRNP